MRGQAGALATVLLGLASPASAQSDEVPRTAEQFIETARETYSVREPEPEPCPTPTNAEIVVCKPYREMDDQRLPSPTERARAARERPPDPITQAPNVLGVPDCGVEFVCHRIGRAPPPIYIIDLSKIPEPLSPEDAALVFRAEDAPQPTASPEAASPAAAP
jgi:hypothetical protein